MSKKSAHKKHSVKRAKSVNHTKSEKFSFDQLLTKKHRPLHAAGLGTLMVFFQGIFATIGIILILGAALAYGLRALKANR